MLGRLIEDLYFLGRFGWFYKKSGTEMKSVGFTQTTAARKNRVKWAWRMATGK